MWVGVRVGVSVTDAMMSLGAGASERKSGRVKTTSEIYHLSCLVVVCVCVCVCVWNGEWARRWVGGISPRAGPQDSVGGVAECGSGWSIVENMSADGVHFDVG